LESLNQIEIRLASRNDIILPALLIAWLGSRLNWQLRKASTKLSEAEFETKGHRIVTKILYDDSTDVIPFALKLIAADQNLEIEILPVKNRGTLQTSIRSAGKSQRVCVTKMDPHDEANMIGKELEILGHDAIFEKALDLVESFLIR
jgi:hypothetical protein